MARFDSRSASRRRSRSVSRKLKRSVSRKRVPDAKPSRFVSSRSPVAPKKTKKARSPSRRAESSESRSASGVEDQRQRSPGSDFGEERLSITNDDAAFILGKGGKTKEKIARVCGAQLNLYEKDLVVEIRGTKRQRLLGLKYVKLVIAQRSGTVYLKDKHDDGDLSVLEIPQEAVGFVTGRNGNFLRTLEDEWRVLLLFVVRDDKRDDRSGRGRSRSDRRRRGKEETLVIFGERRGRRGAELKALSAIEAKCPGFFEAHREEILYRDEDKDWGVSTMEFKNDELAYALGKGGATRKKIEASSGCITQYLGNTAIFAGKEKERKKAKQYTIWLFEQLNGPVFVKDHADRKDCTVLDIPSDCVGYVTGSHRAALGQMEEEFLVLMFFMGSKHDRKESEKLIIFGQEAGRKGAELKVMSTVETKARGFYTSSFREGKSTSKGYGTDVRKLKDDEISYALGARGSTRKKLQRAAGCIIQYIGNYAHIAGTGVERLRATDYLNFLLDQRKGKVEVDDETRSDVLRVEVPRHCIGWVTGNKGQELRRVEEETGTFCFLAQDKYGAERMLVFGSVEGSKYEKIGRIAAKRLIEDLIEEKEHLDRTGRRAGGRRHDSRRRSPSRRSRSRGRFDSRSPPRRGRSRSRSNTPPRRGRSPPRRGRTPPRRGRTPPRRGHSRSRSRSWSSRGDSRSRSRGRGVRRR